MSASKDTCDNVTSLYKRANSTCNPGGLRQILAAEYDNKTHVWYAFAGGVKTIVQAFISEPETLIAAHRLHEFVINSSSNSMTIQFKAPSRETSILFDKPLAVPLNNGNFTILIKQKANRKVLNMQKASIYLFGIPGVKNCGANSCLDSVYEWIKTADRRKQCINDTSYLRYWYGSCFGE